MGSSTGRDTWNTYADTACPPHHKNTPEGIRSGHRSAAHSATCGESLPFAVEYAELLRCGAISTCTALRNIIFPQQRACQKRKSVEMHRRAGCCGRLRVVEPYQVDSVYLFPYIQHLNQSTESFQKCTCYLIVASRPFGGFVGQLGQVCCLIGNVSVCVRAGVSFQKSCTTTRT